MSLSAQCTVHNAVLWIFIWICKDSGFFLSDPKPELELLVSEPELHLNLYKCHKNIQHSIMHSINTMKKCAGQDGYGPVLPERTGSGGGRRCRRLAINSGREQGGQGDHGGRHGQHDGGRNESLGPLTGIQLVSISIIFSLF
jgi:hypothetical protein